MLQIITGKFFRDVKLYETVHRGTIYTNYSMLNLQSTPTACGTIHYGSRWRDVFAPVYEITERLEAIRPDGSNEFLVSTGSEVLIQDFCAVMSIALNVTCSPDIELVRRLTQDKSPSLGVPHVPSRYVRRVLDAEIPFQTGDQEKLQKVVGDLVDLSRADFEAAMPAIRRYVNALHRVGDDLEMAYTLFVAAIESLAQNYTDFEPTWENYDQKKRGPVDKALRLVSDEIAAEVREAVLVGEFLGVSRRFREFAVARIEPSYFREEAAAEIAPIGRSDLSSGLKFAYQFRSKAVHELGNLPKYITALPDHRDTAEVNGDTILTIHGLARLTRHLILEFIRKQPKVLKETIDYRSLLPNVVRVRLSGELWIGDPGHYSTESSRTYLSSFLEQLTRTLSDPAAAVNDLGLVMRKIEQTVPGLSKPKQRTPMLTLYVLFNSLLPLEQRSEKVTELIQQFEADLEFSSPERLLLHTLGMLMADSLTSDKLTMDWDGYIQQRNKGLRFGTLLEAAALLTRAEMCRKEGSAAAAKGLISQAVEDIPGNPLLRAYEELALSCDDADLPEINGRSILLPEPVVPKDGAIGEASAPGMPNEGKPYTNSPDDETMVSTTAKLRPLPNVEI